MASVPVPVVAFSLEPAHNPVVVVVGDDEDDGEDMGLNMLFEEDAKEALNDKKDVIEVLDVVSVDNYNYYSQSQNASVAHFQSSHSDSVVRYNNSSSDNNNSYENSNKELLQALQNISPNTRRFSEDEVALVRQFLAESSMSGDGDSDGSGSGSGSGGGIGDLRAHWNHRLENHEIHEAAQHITQSPSMHHVVESITHMISDRIISLHSQGGFTVPSTRYGYDANSGISAGSESSIPMGVWIKTLYGKSKQEARGSITPFKNVQRGMVFGFDAEVKDNLILGTVYTYAISNTNLNSGKDKQRLHIGAIYGQYTLSPEFAVHGSVKYGKATINSKYMTNSNNSSNSNSSNSNNSNSNNSNNSNNINFNTKGDILRSDIGLNYKKTFENGLILMPKIGATLDIFKMNGFTIVNGTTSSSITGRNGRRYAANISTSIKKTITANEIHITPELTLGLDHTLLMKNGFALVSTSSQTGTITQDNGRGTNPPKNTYNIGTSIHATKSGAIQLGIGYDYSFRPGFKNHSGHVSVSVRF